MPSPSPSRTTAAPSSSVSMPVTEISQRRSTPCARCRSAKTVATSGPSTRSNGSAAPLEHGDLRPGRACRRGHLEPDPAAADDRDPRVRLQRRLDPLAVVDAAQVGDRSVVRAGDGQAARGGTGGEQELVVDQPVSAGGDDLVRAPVDRRHLHPRPEVDVVLGVPALRVDERLLPLGLAHQVVLGQRWPLVRPVLLRAEQHDPAVEAVLAQRLDRLRPGQTGPDHDVRLAALSHGEAPDRWVDRSSARGTPRATASRCASPRAGSRSPSWRPPPGPRAESYRNVPPR